jgi:hypothetical protein
MVLCASILLWAQSISARTSPHNNNHHCRAAATGQQAASGGEVRRVAVWVRCGGGAVLPPSTKECNYGIRAGQTCSKVNNIYTYNFK